LHLAESEELGVVNAMPDVESHRHDFAVVLAQELVVSSEVQKEVLFV
jgi:hypothetical protein